MMARYSETRVIALRLALGLSVFAAILGLISWYFMPELHWWLLLLAVIVFFGFSYFLVQITIDAYVYSKIKLIYKTIGVIKKQTFKRCSQGQKPRIARRSKSGHDGLDEATKKMRLKPFGSWRPIAGSFLGNISHELKTPIFFNIQGYVLTLLDGGLEDENINRNFFKANRKKYQQDDCYCGGFGRNFKAGSWRAKNLIYSVLT